MAIGRDGSRASQFSVCVTAAADYGLSATRGSRRSSTAPSRRSRTNWRDAADAAGLSEADRNMLWKRSILNGSVFYE